VSKLSTALEQWVEFSKTKRGPKHAATKHIKELTPDIVALVTAKLAIDSICRRAKLTSAAVRLGTYLEEEARIADYAKRDPKHFNIIQSKSTEAKDNKTELKFRMRRSMEVRQLPWAPWEKQVKTQLGVICLELLSQSTGIIKLQTTRTRRGKLQVHIVPSDTTLAWLDQAHENNAALFPFYLPCVAVPLDWKGPQGGGYHTNTFLQKPLVKSRDRAFQGELPDIHMPRFYQAINALQRTAWSINEDVMQVMDHLWQEESGLAGLPRRVDLELPEKPANFAADQEARRDWKRKTATIKEQNMRARSLRVQVVKILFMARRYADMGRFWYPFTADFRGRLYPVPYFLQPQGPDEARGLLQFAEGQPLGEHGAKWLAIHGANCWGEDKVTFEERVAWVQENEARILEVGQDPVSFVWWADADKPWAFLAFCLEWWRFKENPDTFVSHIPVAMDGSNNGLQIFSLLLRDENTGASTNCVPQEKPADIYQDVADAATLGLVLQQTEGNETERGWASKWLQFCGGRLGRKSVKRPVMVVPYGGTLYSAQKYLIEWYDESVAEGAEEIWPFDKFNPTMFLSRIAWDAIENQIPAARECMRWLQECADICTEHKVPVRWTSPSGFPVKQDYRKYRTAMIRTKVGETVRKANLRFDKDELSPSRQRNGVSPNFVHSLDSACLHETVARLHDEGVRDFSMIHDSYGVHACHVERMNSLTRETYRDVFTPDLLADFRAEVQALLPAGVDLPQPPLRGTLDVSQLVHADYFFA